MTSTSNSNKRSSTIQGDPTGIGNTESQSKPAKRAKVKNSLKKHWILTIFYGTKDDPKDPMFQDLENLKVWLKLHCEEAVFQVERCPDTGRLHVQLTLHLLEKKRLTWLKLHCVPTAHIEEVKNIEAAFNYSCKSASRQSEPWFWPEQVKKADLRDALDGKEYYAWQQFIIDTAKAVPDWRKIYWFWSSEGEVGKTSFARHLKIKPEVVNGKTCIVMGGNMNDAMYAYKGQDIVFYNFPKAFADKVPYDVMETLKDGMGFSAKFKSQDNLWNPPHVFVFANWPPDRDKMMRGRFEVYYINKTTNEMRKD